MDAFQQQDLPLAEAEGQYAEGRALWVERLLHGPVEGLIQALEAALCAIGADVYAAGVAWAIFRLTRCGRDDSLPVRVDELAYTHVRCSEAQVGRAVKRCFGLVRVQGCTGLRRAKCYAIDWHAVYDRGIGRRSVSQTERSVSQTERTHPRQSDGDPHSRQQVGDPHPRQQVGDPHPRQQVGDPRQFVNEFVNEFEFDDVVISSLSEDQRQRITATARTIAKAYWYSPESTPPDDALLLIFSAAVLGHTYMTPNWAAEGLDAARRFVKKNPAGHLRSVLIARLWEGGTCRKEVSAEYFAALMRAVRPAANQFTDHQLKRREARRKEKAADAEAKAAEADRQSGELKFPPGLFGKQVAKTISHLPEKGPDA